MLLDLSQLRGVEHVARRYEPAALPVGDGDFRVIAPVEFVADVQKDATKVRLTGHLRTTLECECSRCLEPSPVPVDEKFDLLFMPASADAGEDREVADEDLGVSFYKDDVIDLSEVMREQFYLALPMK